MKHQVAKRWKWVSLVVGLLWVALAVPARVWAHGPADGGANADTVQGLFTVVLWIALPIFLLVEGLIIFAIIRYRRRRADEMPEQVHGNTPLEVTWTVMSFAIVAVLFVLTLRALQTDYQVEADEGSDEATPDLTVQVTGYMFNWDYDYILGDSEETGVMTTKRLHIPANRKVLLEITSSDVQHSFWVPDLAGKVDAIPGYTNTMWLEIDKTGTYTGNCAEYCGLNHYNMLIEVEVMEPQEFDTWMAGQMASSGESVPMGTDMDSALPPGDVASGEQVFNDLACNACHAKEAQPSGPGLMQMANDTAEVEGYTTDEYLRESILMPCAVLAEGWDQCIMPQNYGERLDAQKLADLIEYIKTQAD